jgi:hypothetical protein
MHKKTVLFWWIPIFIIVGSFVMYAYSQTLFTIQHSHTLTVFNLKNSEVIVNGESLLLYDSKTFDANPISRVTVGQENFNIETKKNISYLDIKVVSDTPHCFFTAEVSDYYQGIGEPKITKVITEDDNYLSLEINPNKYEYLVPGEYTLDTDSEKIEKELVGVYPIDCGQKGDEEAMKDLVKVYRFLDPERERELIDRVSP